MWSSIFLGRKIQVEVEMPVYFTALSKRCRRNWTWKNVLWMHSILYTKYTSKTGISVISLGNFSGHWPKRCAISKSMPVQYVAILFLQIPRSSILYRIILKRRNRPEAKISTYNYVIKEDGLPGNDEFNRHHQLRGACSSVSKVNILETSPTGDE